MARLPIIKTRVHEGCPTNTETENHTQDFPFLKHNYIWSFFSVSPHSQNSDTVHRVPAVALIAIPLAGIDLEPSNRCAVSDQGCKAPQRARWGPLPPAASSQGTLREAGCDKCMKQRCKPVLQIRKWVQRQSNFLNTKANKSPSSGSTDPVHRAEDVLWGRWRGGTVRTPGRDVPGGPQLCSSLHGLKKRMEWDKRLPQESRPKAAGTDRPARTGAAASGAPAKGGRQTQGIAQSLPVKCLGWAGL